MTATDIIPAHLIPLLEAPNYAFLGTVRPDDTVQVNPMWFDFDGETLRIAHHVSRQVPQSAAQPDDESRDPQQ